MWKINIYIYIYIYIKRYKDILIHPCKPDKAELRALQ